MTGVLRWIGLGLAAWFALSVLFAVAWAVFRAPARRAARDRDLCFWCGDRPVSADGIWCHACSLIAEAVPVEKQGERGGRR